MNEETRKVELTITEIYNLTEFMKTTMFGGTGANYKPNFVLDAFYKLQIELDKPSPSAGEKTK